MKIRYIQKRILTFTLAFLMACSVLVPLNISGAKDSFVADYIQTVYNQNTGIGSNEINCILQSSSGYIWIGTEGGLYRSNGSQFNSINLWDTDRADIYAINALIQDVEGRVWIATDNYGLFYVEDGETIHLQDEYYNGIKSILDVAQSESGIIYVATSSGLYTCQKDADNIMRMVPYIDADIAKMEFSDIEANGEDLWAIYGNNDIYILNDEGSKKKINTSEITSDELSCVNNLGRGMYVGTTGRSIIKFVSDTEYVVLNTSIDGINSLMLDSNGYVWACADNGIGYFKKEEEFVKTNDCEIDSYLSDMIQDYEGNYWIVSNKMGVLCLSKSKFSDFNLKTGMSETIVNTVFMYKNQRYIGTDDGLFIFNGANDRVNNELTEMLSGISVKNIIKDDIGNIWISTGRRYGIIKVAADNTITSYARNIGLPSIAINSVLPLKDHKVAVATEEGVAIIDENGNLSKVFGREQGIVNNNILCLYQDKNGLLYVGTDEGGLYVIDINYDEIINYDMEDGLNSNVITAIEPGTEGLWIATDNGLCFYKDSFRAISNVEYTNSIYDIVIDNEFIWLVGSMGVLRTTESELLGSSGISGRYYDSNDGLAKTINTTGKAYIDNNGLLYICCNEGIYTLDTSNIPYNLVAPRIKVTSISLDGTIYEFDDLADGLKVRSDISRITIDFAVFSFNNRNDIQVQYSLKGFDNEPIVISGNDLMQAVYTNLDGGVYEFEITAYNSDGTMCEAPVSFIIEKETSLADSPIARIGIIFIILTAFIVLVFVLLWVKKVLKNKDSALEKLSKEHEEAVKSSSAKNDYLANMSNEIKTPINAMMARADELLVMPKDHENYDNNIRSIYDIGKNIINKVDDIILLAKLEAGKLEATEMPYSVTTMMYDLSEIAMNMIGDRTVKFFVEIGDNVTDTLVGDEEKLKDTLYRLLSNAIRYTKEGSITLSVDCFEYSDKARPDIINLMFTISDTGIGIQEERLDSIFEVYNIADNKKNSLHSGNGVGLAIAKGYADLLGGELDVESVYGAGSSFTLSIDQKIAKDSDNIHVGQRVEGTVSKEVADSLWLPEVKALVVDDDDVSRHVAVKVLTDFETKVDEASSGVSAIDLVMNNDYDVIFMDLTMPIMNGIETMQEIRELDGTKYAILPIIAMDTDAIEGDSASLLEAGFTDRLIKPMESRRVAAILKDCLSEEKIKERAGIVEQYIDNSRFKDGLCKLKDSLEVEYVLERIGGSIEVYNKLIYSFYNQNLVVVDELPERLDKDARGFKTRIHSLRTNSINIGALELAKKASSIEAAININNKEYVKDNLDEFIGDLKDILELLYNYLVFIEDVSNMTDEEYIKKYKNADDTCEEEISKEGIFEDLNTLKARAAEEDFEQVDKIMNRLLSFEYEGEDRDFMEALYNVVAEHQKEDIIELVNTYFALKM